nr:type II toxin-antitoxin system RelE/ParE family toxin [Neorhizobium galegae]
MERCRAFLKNADIQIVHRASRAIDRQITLLETSPEIGRPFPGERQLRELLIPFGDSGYVALYRYDIEDDAVYVLAFRHQKEAGY